MTMIYPVPPYESESLEKLKRLKEQTAHADMEAEQLLASIPSGEPQQVWELIRQHPDRQRTLLNAASRRFGFPKMSALFDLVYGQGVSHAATQPQSKLVAPPGDMQLRTKVEKKYGVAPKHYDGVLDGKGGYNQRAILEAIPQVAEQLNQVAEQKGASYRFTPAEIATNFLAEGAFDLAAAELDLSRSREPIRGFSDLGIDTFMDRWNNELAPWASKDLSNWANDPANTATNRFRGTKIRMTLDVRDLHQAVEANAVMFAAARERFITDVRSLKMNEDHITPEAWFFWTVLYFNAGEDTARFLLMTHKLDWWKQKYEGPPRTTAVPSVRNPEYNAMERTATWDYIEQRGLENMKAK